MEATHPLRAYRDAQQPKLSQRELAELLGVTVATVSRWETGERQPEPERLSIITEKTGIPARELRPDLAEQMGAVG